MRKDYPDEWNTADLGDQGREEEVETSGDVQDQTEGILRQTRGGIG